MLSAALISQSCLSSILSGIARNKKNDEGKIQKAITKYMKDHNYRWPNYHPVEGDEEEEEVDDVPLVSGDTHPSSPLVTCCAARVLLDVAQTESCLRYGLVL